VRCQCEVTTEASANRRNIRAVGVPNGGGGWEGGGAGGGESKTNAGAAAASSLLPGTKMPGPVAAARSADTYVMSPGSRRVIQEHVRGSLDGTTESTIEVLRVKMDQAKIQLATTSIVNVDDCCKLAEFIAVCGRALTSLR
jgi:hypothetical protein